MSLINKKFCAILLLLSLSVYSQDLTQQELETLKSNISGNLATAQANLNVSQYFQAQQYLDLALEDAIEVDDKKSQGLIYSKMGKVNYILEAPEDALKMLIKASELQRFSKDYINLAETHKIKGDVYMYTKDYSKALDYYKSAETYFNQEDLHNHETEAILKKGQALLATGNHKKALKVFEKAITMAKRYQLNKILSASLFSIAEAQLKEDDIKEALNNATNGFQIAKENDFSDILNTGYLTLSKLYEKDNDLKLSNLYLKAHMKLSDSLLQLKRTNIATEKKQFLVANQTEYIKQEKANLEDEETSTFDQLTTILSIALITILSLLTLSLYKNNNIRLKSNNILHKKNSELIVAMEKAELASRTKANFLSTVTHELRTPLYAVTGLTNMLLDEDPKAEQVQHLKSLKFSGDYLLTFINDILQINKIEANKVDIEPEVFNLKKKIANVISALNNSALDNNIKIHLEYDDNLPLNYNADQLKISQILINLIGNSIKFTKDGDIWVRATKINEKNGLYNIRFEVEDNGIGISKEKQENMFESFSQGSIQINRKYGGTGLGLSIVKGLIDILKGKIYLKSELGKGSTFFFELPMKFTEEVIREKEVNYFKNIDEIELSDVKILV